MSTRFLIALARLLKHVALFSKTSNPKQTPLKPLCESACAETQRKSKITDLHNDSVWVKTMRQQWQPLSKGIYIYIHGQFFAQKTSTIVNHTFAISRYQKILVCLKIGYPESHGLSSFPIVKLPFGGYTVYWYTTFSGTPKSCSVGYILISPWYLRKKLRKNINSCGWLYIYTCICVYISICGFLQYLLIQIQWSWLGIQPNWFYISWSDIYIYNPTIFRQKFPAIH